jgi:glycosyltransferase involved in cell wall biosynthesis
VRFEHGLSDAALEQLFRRCFCLLSTSLMEGFDYPLLEAQARGLPTLASDIAVHREFHTDTSLLFAGDDRGASLAAALQQLASDHGTWLQLSQLGLQQAQWYSLDRQSRAIQDVLQAQRR